MRRLAFILASALATSTLATAPALACRGTAEYPAVEQEIAQSSLPADAKARLMQEWSEGKALHDAAHASDDKAKMKESLEILDRIKQQLE